jgi:hypothetical protein
MSFQPAGPFTLQGSGAPTIFEEGDRLVNQLRFDSKEVRYQPVDEVVVQLRGFGSKLMAMAAV